MLHRLAEWHASGQLAAAPNCSGLGTYLTPATDTNELGPRPPCMDSAGTPFEARSSLGQAGWIWHAGCPGCASGDPQA